MRFIVPLILLATLSSKSYGYYDKVGPVTELRMASYYAEVCVKIGGVWFYFDGRNPDLDFMKSIVLTSYASGKNALAGTGRDVGVTDKKCDSKQAYPLQLLDLR